MPIFIERYLLPVFAAVTVVLGITNPMNFDLQQRISAAVFFLAAAYFVSHSLHLKNKKNEDTLLPSKNEPAKPRVEAKTTGDNSPIITAGDNSAITINQRATGREIEEQAARIAEEVVDRMRATSVQKDDEISRRFPLGYAVFGVIGVKKIVPLREPSGKLATVNWEVGEILGISPSEIAVRLIDVTLESGDVLQNCAVILPRISGATFYLWSLEPGHHLTVKNLQFRLKYPPLVWTNAPVRSSENPTMAFVVEIIATEAAGDVLVFGLKSF